MQIYQVPTILSKAAEKRVKQMLANPIEGIVLEYVDPVKGKYTTLRSKDLRIIMRRANLEHLYD